MGSHHLFDFARDFLSLAGGKVDAFGPIFDCGQNDSRNNVRCLFVSQFLLVGDVLNPVGFHQDFVDSVGIVHGS